MAIFSAILALENSRVHIGSLNGHNVPADIEASVDKCFGFAAALNIPYVHPDDGHVQFGQNLNNSGLGH